MKGQALKPTEFDSGETCPTVLLQCLPSSSRQQVQRSQLWRSLGTVTVSNLLPKHLVLPCLASPLVKWGRNLTESIHNLSGVLTYSHGVAST